MGNIFFEPRDGAVADIIPFFDRGEFWLYYLHDFREHRTADMPAEGTPWRLVRTGDLASFTEEGEVVPQGTPEEQDYYVYTGSVVKKGEGDYYLFYTGHNPHLENGPMEAVMLARSADLLQWEKADGFRLAAPADYEPDDWRDPFVFFDEAEGTYKMLLAARKRGGPKGRSGCTAMAASDDLLRWEVGEPLWAPEAYFTHECPDLFRLGGLWYLVFSEFSDRRCTQYRVSESPQGPWRVPEGSDGLFDGRAFYAAKTACDGEDRYVFGWDPTKEENSDCKPWQWGGTMVIHRLSQGENGGLRCHMPASVRARFTRELFSAERLTVGGPGRTAIHPVEAAVPKTYLLSADIVAGRGVRQAGLCLRNDDAGDLRYAYIFDLAEERLSFVPVPQAHWRYADFVGVERKAPLRVGERRHVEVLVDGDVCVLYSDGVALSSRMGRLDPGLPPALYAADGEVRFENVVLKTIGENA